MKHPDLTGAQAVADVPPIHRDLRELPFRVLGDVHRDWQDLELRGFLARLPFRKVVHRIHAHLEGAALGGEGSACVKREGGDDRVRETRENSHRIDTAKSPLSIFRDEWRSIGTCVVDSKADPLACRTCPGRPRSSGSGESA